jgi:hypothetical protein
MGGSIKSCSTLRSVYPRRSYTTATHTKASNSEAHNTARANFTVQLESTKTTPRTEPGSLDYIDVDFEIFSFATTQIDEDCDIFVPLHYIHQPDDSLEAGCQQDHTAKHDLKITRIDDNIGDSHLYIVHKSLLSSSSSNSKNCIFQFST